jgi:hypothetical protein
VSTTEPDKSNTVALAPASGVGAAQDPQVAATADLDPSADRFRIQRGLGRLPDGVRQSLEVVVRR